MTMQAPRGAALDALGTSLETAKRLKAAGFPQNTVLSFEPIGTTYSVMATHDCVLGQSIAAPSAQELADQLPGNIELYRSKRWFAVDAALKSEIAQNVGEADSMVEALAALWLAIREVQQ